MDTKKLCAVIKKYRKRLGRDVLMNRYNGRVCIMGACMLEHGIHPSRIKGWINPHEVMDPEELADFRKAYDLAPTEEAALISANDIPAGTIYDNLNDALSC